MVADENTFRREGEYWTISFEGSICRLRDTKGLRHLAYLLQHPSERIAAADLLDATSARATPTATTGNGEEASPPAGPDPIPAYEARLAQLQRELEAAESTGDAAVGLVLRQEISFLSGRLALAAQTGRVDASAERARLAVTKGIKSALEKIRANHPSLGRHLSATIKRGYFCCYLPDPRLPIRWTI